MSDERRKRQPAVIDEDRLALAAMLGTQPPQRRAPQLFDKGMPLDDVSVAPRTPGQHAADFAPQGRAAQRQARLVAPTTPAKRSRARRSEGDTPRQPVVAPLADARADLQAAQATHDEWAGRNVAEWVEQAGGRSWLPLLFIALVSIGIIVALSPQREVVISPFGPRDTTVQAEVAPAAPVDANGEHPVVGRSTISAEMIDAVLAHYGSPAAGSGAFWVAAGQRYNLDAAYALAFFIHESTAGTHPNWAGNKPDGSKTHNVGNIICAGYATCYGRFRDYPSWEAGIEDWYRLIAVEYVEGRGTTTLEQIIPIYAPSVENDVPRYVATVQGLIDDWRRGVVR